MNLVLIGMRGTGKSNLSRRLSVLSKRPVLSTDLLISYDNGGRAIADILATHGGDWRAFRDMEYAVIQKTTALDGLIIDAGGGVVVDVDETGAEIYSQRKMEFFKKKGLVIWLKGDIPRLAAKVASDGQRPALSAQHSAEEVMHRRLPFYERAADRVVNIENRSRKKLALEIYEMFASDVRLDG